MPRRDREYRARLRVDAASSWVAGMAIAAGRAESVTPWAIATVIAAIASRLFHDRSTLKREGPDRWV